MKFRNNLVHSELKPSLEDYKTKINQLETVINTIKKRTSTLE